MKNFVPSVILVLVSFIFCPHAQAANTPDYLTMGGGDYDFDKHPSDRRSIDYRAEYRWGASLLPLIGVAGLDSFMQLHPAVGVEGNSRDAVYPNAGFNLDIPFLWKRGIFTWGEAAGIYGHGNDPSKLGSLAEFRSQLELGVRFDDDVRVTGYISHLSNANITRANPGAEIVGMYLHLPLWDKPSQ